MGWNHDGKIDEKDSAIYHTELTGKERNTIQSTAVEVVAGLQQVVETE